MNKDRYFELEISDEPLTIQEIKDGWLFCNCELDGMLINKSWEEAKMCNCIRKETSESSDAAKSVDED